MADRRALARGACGAVSAAVVLLVLVPWRPAMPAGSLDPSWQTVLHHAFTHGHQFGRDLVFTYGPWGFVGAPRFFPETYPLLLAAWCFLALALWAGAAEVARRAFPASPVAPLWAVAPALVAALAPDAVLLSLAVAYVAVDAGDDGRRPPAAWGLAVALAFAGLVKFSSLIAAAAALGGVGARDLLVRRRAPWPLALFVAALAAFWLAAGQAPLGFFAYLRWSLEISGGYSVAMPWTGRWTEIVGFCAAAALLLVSVVLARGRGARAAAASALALAALLFLMFKAGFVRHDVHALYATSSLLAAALLWAPWVVARRGLAAATLAVALAVSAAVHAYALAHYTRTGLTAALFRPAPALAADVWALLTGSLPSRARYEESLRRAALQPPITPPPASVDVYGFDQTAVIAAGLNYTPRPVFQGYATYTPALAERNAAWLRSASAPELLLAEATTIDGRLPLLDDARSWPELLARYEVEARRGDALQLRRRAAPLGYALVPTGQLEARLGVPVEVPAAGAGPVWADIRVEPKLVGAVATLLFRAPNLQLTVRLRSGAVEYFRFIPTMARGFVLSPAVTSPDHLEALFRADAGARLRGRDVVSFTIGSSRGEWLYEPAFAVRFYRLEPRPGGGAGTP